MKPLKFIFILILLLNFTSCVINNPKPEDCEIVIFKVSKIKEGPSYDIVFYNDKGDFYYINRGLQQGLNLEDLNTKVLNKTVTLHIAKMLGGKTSNHIAQLATNDAVIFTELDLN